MINSRADVIILIFAWLLFASCSSIDPDDEFTFHRILKRQTLKNTASCEVPTESINQVLSIYDLNHEPISNRNTRSSVPTFTLIESQCSTGYLLLDGSNTSSSFCNHAGEWLPALKSCHRVCPILRASNVVLTCKDKRGGFIDCDSPLLTKGTQVTANCMPLHQVDPLSRTDSDYIQCRDDGRWNKELIKCVPECGIPLHQPLIVNGSEAQYGEFPWHVAIYRVSIGNKYICGGTLITSNMVLSAAHCFYNESMATPNKDPGDFMVIVGKMTSDFNRVDNIQQQKLQISRIQFALNEYNPTLSYASDIAILILKKNVTISQYVLPACFRRPERNGNFRPAKNSPGALPGWGLDENDRVSTTLKMALLPFMDYNTCAKKVAHVTIDKFCAGADTGPRPLQGDSGGGLVFKEGLFYYVRGIVSTRGKWSDSSLTTFTDLSFYQDWIESVVQQSTSGIETGDERHTNTEQSVLLPSNTSPPTSKTSTHTTMNMKTTVKPTGDPLLTRLKAKDESIPDERCKALSTSKMVWSCKQVADCKLSSRLLATSQDYRCGPSKERICCPESTSSQSKNYTQIINQKCVEYAEARFQNVCPKGQTDGTSCSRVMDCDRVETLISGGVEAKPKEFPHMALIGAGEKLDEIYWMCGGTLISERFILTSAHCSEDPYNREPAVWIGLGFLNKSELTSAESNKNKLFRIERWHRHPSYKEQFFNHDIGLAQLRNPVQFSPFIRPICLHTEYIIPRKSLDDVTVAGWGKIDAGSVESETLLKAHLRVISNELCTATFKDYERLQSGYDGENMMCIGSPESRQDTCARDGGGPIQIKHTMECMYTQLGIISFGRTVCGFGDPSGGIRLSSYLDWIQKIVWP